ncbi:hypothetical protein [Flectobacillus roseus]|uniref:hypothetical protein n=1 Tax=Flectobacillus roseus TaxID=502259 RepID=UPI0024B6BFAF|nr:hypothetical protein [Flectobacillus roseus]MDI9872128.1 hypothetical protein [Flectobacillus roseus]
MTKKTTRGRVQLPPEVAERKREMSSCALIVEFQDGNKRLYWTNEFSANCPTWKRGNIQILTEEFRAWDFFTKMAHKVKSAAIFDTRTNKQLKPEYKLVSFERGLWYYTVYGQQIL